MKASGHDEFREFVAMRSTALLRLAVLLTGGDRHGAEDLLQIALMKVYGRWSSIEQPEAYERQVMYRQSCPSRAPTPTPGPSRSCGSRCGRHSAGSRNASGPWSSCATSRTCRRPRSRRC
jgi:hypothetical protein